MTDSETIRVALVDDQAVARRGFRAILESEPDIEVVAEASDGRAGIDVARQERPDVVLMDVRMPFMDGLEATRLLAGPDVDDPIDVLVVTTFELEEYVFTALRYGAAGFLLKDIDPDELVAAVRTVASGNGLVAPELFVEETTVKTHLRSLLQKLGLRDRIHVVIYAYEHGLVRPSERHPKADPAGWPAPRSGPQQAQSSRRSRPAAARASSAGAATSATTAARR